MCFTFIIFMIILVDYLSFFDYFRIKITILVYMIKQIFGFGIFLAMAIISFGIVVQVSMFGSYDNSYVRKLLRNMITYAFYPIFGNMDVFDKNFFLDKYFDDNYSRDVCMTENNMTVPDGLQCPYRTGVVFSYNSLIVYLILMNIVFINLLISTFGY
jgi:hypothetical protein